MKSSAPSLLSRLIDNLHILFLFLSQQNGINLFHKRLSFYVRLDQTSHSRFSPTQYPPRGLYGDVESPRDSPIATPCYLEISTKLLFLEKAAQRSIVTPETSGSTVLHVYVQLVLALAIVIVFRWKRSHAIFRGETLEMLDPVVRLLLFHRTTRAICQQAAVEKFKEVGIL